MTTIEKLNETGLSDLALRWQWQPSKATLPKEIQHGILAMQRNGNSIYLLLSKEGLDSFVNFFGELENTETIDGFIVSIRTGNLARYLGYLFDLYFCPDRIYSMGLLAWKLQTVEKTIAGIPVRSLMFNPVLHSMRGQKDDVTFNAQARAEIQFLANHPEIDPDCNY